MCHIGIQQQARLAKNLQNLRINPAVSGASGGAFVNRKRWELDRMGELFRIAAKSRSGGMADASDSKSGGLNAREGSTPSFGRT